MKICYVFLLCCLFVAASPSIGRGEGALHTFTTPDGRSLNATIKGYNARNGKIQIKREDGKELWTLPTVFSETDQNYIQQWISGDQFMSPMKFRIEADSSKDKISKNKTEIEYEITLGNRTDFPLKDLRIEYRAFILNKGYEDKEDSNRVGGGELIIAEIPAGERISKKLDPITLVTQFKTVTESYGHNKSETYEKKMEQEELKGFWIKVYGPMVDGGPAIREWCNPPDTSKDFQWQGNTTAALPTPERPDLINEARRLRDSDPNRALELYLKAYEKVMATSTMEEIGILHIYYFKPNDISNGLVWLERAAGYNGHRACIELARFFATYEDPHHHDIKKAIKYGRQAVEIEPKNYVSHRTLATAYAHKGRFENAIKHQELALELCMKSGHSTSVSEIEEELELYQNKEIRQPQ